MSSDACESAGAICAVSRTLKPSGCPERKRSRASRCHGLYHYVRPCTKAKS
jgi:hypothetical protein